MLAAGTLLGPYEILGHLGEGGMGEVYRAKDTRLGRKVAIKVLPRALATDPDRLLRFEQEARAVGMLNHPNILAIYDVRTYEGSPYLVSELLEGQTLHARLGGVSVGPRKAIEYALQVARGLAAAHDKGITHRDLKPENIFITRDGRVKILDFGLAKLTRPETQQGGPPTGTHPAAPRTEAGIVLGTVGYMSPEQVRGHIADHRSDIFNLGAILYEMCSGKRAFRGEEAAETMHAILKDEPPPIPVAHPTLSPALERIIRHCLEKDPENRFHSAHDIAFDLEALSGPSGQAALAWAPVRSRRFVLLLVAGLLSVLTLAVGLVIGQRLGKAPLPTFHQLTFRRGTILSARFAPDGQTIVYGASWDGNPVELFSTRPESPDSRSLGFPGTEILAISSTGEMAISLERRVTGFIGAGTLARESLAGGASREILEDVQQADWGPAGANLAVVREVSGRSRLEFPIGKVLYETAGWISHARLSPKGDLIAFVDHPVQGDDGGAITIVDLAGKKSTLSRGWLSAQGLAWSPKGAEVWFTATRFGSSRALYAVSVNGRERAVARLAGMLTLHDISRDGRALLSRENRRRGLEVLPPGETKERDLSWLDSSLVRDISPDGKTVLFGESGEGGGATYAVYVRKTDGSPAVRIGEGSAQALSPDGKWVLSITSQSSSPQLVLFPTGPGESIPLERQGINYQAASWFPDGKRILIMGNEPGHPVRFYVHDLETGKLRAITPEGVAGPRVSVSPDGKLFAARGADGKLALYSVEGGQPRAIPGLAPGDVPSQWSPDGRSLYVYQRTELPAKVYRLDLATGRKELWKQFMPADPAGIDGLAPILRTPDGKSHVYSYTRQLSELYLVEGLR
ncbi:MAG: serine/threonine-protein kinase [Acidobacteria bacterium]|nr:serine/threonine-protein kinase [Acidobacteriota bacterium]